MSHNDSTIHNTTLQARTDNQLRPILLALYPDLSAILHESDIVEQFLPEQSFFITTGVGHVRIKSGTVSMEVEDVDDTVRGIPYASPLFPLVQAMEVSRLSIMYSIIVRGASPLVGLMAV